MSPIDLALIDLDQPEAGYRRFISCWVLRRGGLSVVVDPGPSRSIPHLVSELRRRGVERLDLVLLTHIHLDHGGGAAELLRAFPGARVHCHPGGVRHLEDPGKLWQGSLATIGRVAEMYGRPEPVPQESFAPEEELRALGVEVIPTPGHAPHHAAFRVGEVLFAGEAIATRMALAGGREYLRPATPPRFEPGVFLASLARLEALEPEPARVALAHHGEAAGLRALAARARAQLELWLEVVRQARASLPGGSEAELLDASLERLLGEDPAFGQGAFQALPADIQTRERYYVQNSLRGLLGSLAALPPG
jgi:glyoxylase-like metal-dependent hydrolase (beta-lactamase superfamily II)